MKGLNLLHTICRALVGGVFIVSGLVKMNDVLGFSYKLEEYFEPTALNWPAMAPFALYIAMLIVAAEVMLGVALVMRILPKLSSVLVLVMTIFFLWLTHYTASCIDRRNAFVPTEKVESFTETCVETCGCFGEAIPLEPRESFYKDLVLMILVIPVVLISFRKTKFENQEDILLAIALALVVAFVFAIQWLDWYFPLIYGSIIFGLLYVVHVMRKKHVFISIGIVLLSCLIFQFYTYRFLPIKDYSSYKIGNDLSLLSKSSAEAMKASAFGQFVEDVNRTLPDSLQWIQPIVGPSSIEAFKKYVPTISAGSQTDLWLQNIDLNDDAWVNELVKYAPTITKSYYTLQHLQTGEIIELDETEYNSRRMWEDKNWKMDPSKTRQVVLKKGFERKIKDFMPEDEFNTDMRDSLFEMPRVFLVVIKDLDEANGDAMKDIAAFATEAQKEGIRFYAITSEIGERVRQFQFEHQTPFEYLTNDQTELKIMVRSNPGVIYLEKGVVKGKWSYAGFPDYARFKSTLLQ